MYNKIMKGSAIMKKLKIAIEEFAENDGIDLLGFADKSRCDDVDAQHNPFSIFPEAKTVIMVGKRICRGSLRGIEEGTNFGDYQLFGKNWLEDEFIALSAYNLTNFIESHGWEAVPVFPNPCDIEPAGIPVAEGKAAPNVFPDFDYAAVACDQSRFNARCWMLGAGALGRPRGMVWGGRREEGSGWGTHVYLWWIHFDIWQN